MIFKLAALSKDNRENDQTSLLAIGRDHSTKGRAPTIPQIKNVSQWFGLIYYWGHIWKAPDSLSKQKVFPSPRFGASWIHWESSLVDAFVYMNRKLMLFPEQAWSNKLQICRYSFAILNPWRRYNGLEWRATSTHDSGPEQSKRG